MIKRLTNLSIVLVLFCGINLFGYESLRELGGYKQVAYNIIQSAKIDYPANCLVNAIVRRDVAAVNRLVGTTAFRSQNIDQVYQFNIESSGLEGMLSQGELQERMLSLQTGLSLAVLSSTFDTTPEEMNKSLSIIKLLLEAKSSNVSLSNSYFIKDRDGCIRDFEEDASVFGWMILSGCREEILRLVLDAGFLMNADVSTYTLYKELAEGSGNLDLAKIIDEYSALGVSRQIPKVKSFGNNRYKKSKPSKNKTASVFSGLLGICLTKNTVLKNNLNSLLDFGWN